MSARGLTRWVPALLLGLGVVAVSTGATTQHPMFLRAPLAAVVPRTMDGAAGQDVEISAGEQRVAGMDSYVLREYTPAGAAPFSVYVGYYREQARGRTIHSPKNCLPGGGWEPLTSRRITLDTPAGPAEVNRYLIGNDQAQAVVLYWYQGRGRVAANEYTVKWDLLRDQALRGRSDEALVRVIVPVEQSEADASARAVKVARRLVPAVYQALPE